MRGDDGTAADRPRREPIPALRRSLAAIDGLNRHLRAFISLADRTSLQQQGEASSSRFRLGRPRSPLDGLTVAVKDNIDTADLATTHGSALFEHRRPGIDAEVVRRLRGGGALIVGKTNMTELACGTVGRNRRFGDVGNPADGRRVPGGSSSGSAAAVAAGMVDVALGTDTTCSIRYPAAACGLVGLKPTAGRVSNRGVGVCATAIDHVGPMAASVEVAAAALSVIQCDGWDDPRARLGLPLRGLRIGVLTGDPEVSCSADVLTGRATAIAALVDLGCAVMPIDTTIDPSLAVEHADVLCREMLSVYGGAVEAGMSVVGPEVREWFGRYRSHDRAAMIEAERYRQRLTVDCRALLGDVDAVVCPTMRERPPRWSEVDASDRLARVGNCAVWSMTGLPSLTVPVPVSARTLSGSVERSDDLRTTSQVGLLVTGRSGADATVLQIGAALHRATAPLGQGAIPTPDRSRSS